MLQRKQTLYLLAAIIITAICLSLPLGRVEPATLTDWITVYTLFIKGATIDYSVWPLFVILVATYPIAIMAIALFKNRMLQAKLCTWAVVLNIAWYAYYAYAVFTKFAEMGTFHIEFAAGLPFIAIIFYLLARKGIMDDEKLVRSADRIR